ncbi:MAG: alpha/beta hydrolase [Blastomonas sp.]
MRSIYCFLCMVLFCAGVPGVAQAGDDVGIVGGLERKLDKPLDAVPDASIEYGVLETSDGARLRTIFSKPADASGPTPVIYFVQWLSCSTIELRDDDGWTQMLTELIGKSGYAVMRTEKSGVGDSEGSACNNLDYDTEVRHHREALAALFARDDIDRKNVFIFGGSMGANQAPLIADGFDVAGVIAWGGGAKTWYERMLGFDRRSLEFTETDPAKVNATMALRARFHASYLLEGRHPGEIIAQQPETGAVWEGMIGTAASDHYGRPFAFHHQAERANWAAAWAKVKVPTLVMYGEYDWFEDLEAHRWIVDIVNANHPDLARLVIMPATNHHFSRYPDRRSAFEEVNGEMVGDEAAGIIASWINEVIAR